jgi:hypothetical protein
LLEVMSHEYATPGRARTAPPNQLTRSRKASRSGFRISSCKAGAAPDAPKECSAATIFTVAASRRC